MPTTMPRMASGTCVTKMVCFKFAEDLACQSRFIQLSIRKNASVFHGMFGTIKLVSRNIECFVEYWIRMCPDPSLINIYKMSMEFEFY